MTARMRRRTGTAFLIVIASLLAACGPSTRWMSASPSASGSAGAGGTSGTASWSDCQDEASQITTQLPGSMTYDCATIKVPQNWKNKDNGKTFDIAMMRAHSASQSSRIGSLVVNPGGPGGSGVELAVYLSSELPQEILDKFDIVGFDPRGVGRSSPVKCFTGADLDASFGEDPDPQSQADFDAVVALNKKMADECQTKYGDTLSLFSTEQSARDMDAVRAAVGDAKINYLGFSYGTLLGATYAQLFPKNIRSFVLDGAVDPTQKPVDAAEGQAAGFEHAYDEFSTWCGATPVSCPITGGDARAAATALMNQGRTNPAVNADGRKATAGWVLTGISAALYDQSAWPILGRAMSTLAQGNAKIMFQLADSYADRGTDGTYGNMFDIFNTVSCDDDNSGETVDQARQLQSQWRAKYPLFGASLALGVISCAVWEARRDPYPTGKATGAPPIVVVGTLNDPATPYAQTAKLSNMLGVGHVVTWNGEGHTAYPKTTCVRAAVDAYFIKGDIPQSGLTCPAK